jgi:hypothetical protein
MLKVSSIIPAAISLVTSYLYFRSSGTQSNLLFFILLFVVVPLSMIWSPQVYKGKTNWIFGRLAMEEGMIVFYGWILLLIPMAVVIIGVYRTL